MKEDDQYKDGFLGFLGEFRYPIGGAAGLFVAAQMMQGDDSSRSHVEAGFLMLNYLLSGGSPLIAGIVGLAVCLAVAAFLHSIGRR